MKNLTIIGGSGFIGTYLLKKLVLENHSVTNFDLDKSKVEPKLPMLSKFLSLVFWFMVFFDRTDINFTNLSAVEMLTPLFL